MANLNRAAFISHIDGILRDAAPDGSIIPSVHNDILVRILNLVDSGDFQSGQEVLDALAAHNFDTEVTNAVAAYFAADPIQHGSDGTDGSFDITWYKVAGANSRPSVAVISALTWNTKQPTGADFDGWVSVIPDSSIVQANQRIWATTVRWTPSINDGDTVAWTTPRAFSAVDGNDGLLSTAPTRAQANYDVRVNAAGDGFVYVENTGGGGTTPPPAPTHSTYLGWTTDATVTSIEILAGETAVFAEPQVFSTLPTAADSTGYLFFAQPATDNEVSEIIVGGTNQLSVFTKLANIDVNGTAYEVWRSSNPLVVSTVTGTVTIRR